MPECYEKADHLSKGIEGSTVVLLSWHPCEAIAMEHASIADKWGTSHVTAHRSAISNQMQTMPISFNFNEDDANLGLFNPEPEQE